MCVRVFACVSVCVCVLALCESLVLQRPQELRCSTLPMYAIFPCSSGVMLRRGGGGGEAAVSFAKIGRDSNHIFFSSDLQLPKGLFNAWVKTEL